MASRRTWYVFTPFAAWLLTASCSGEDSHPEAVGGFWGTGGKDASTDSSGAADGGVSIPCTEHGECPDGLYCVDGRCIPPPSSLDCPSDMVSVANLFCVDRFEASRQDATEKNEGVATGRAYSRGMVMPWRLFTNEEAAQACVLAGKRLCTPAEWQLACEGPSRTVYGYGDQYEPATCNGIETFGLLFHLVPTGSLPDCVSGWGAYDLNGNLWEHVLGGDSTTIRGGAYNCSDSRTLHRCDYIPASWSPTARGFRCCLNRDENLDASVLPDVGADALLDAVSEGVAEAESGCVEPDAWPDVAPDVVEDVTLDVAADVALEGGGDASFDGSVDAAPDGSLDADEPDVVADVVADVVSDSVDEEAQSGPCPADMVLVDTFCMDRYEASHADATSTSMGTAPTATSRAGVFPWVPVDLAAARQACELAGKRLCRPDEWVWACSGPADSVYAYGNDYEAATCNGIDAYCDCGSVACEALTECPYPHCFNQASSEGGGPCGANYHLVRTGTFPDCTSPLGIYDLNGNAWELVDTNDGLEHFRGGAFNCGDSVTLHRCDYDATWGPTAPGFRCCRDPS